MFDYHKRELEEAERLWSTGVNVDESGIVRWKSNGSCPFSDMLDKFIENGHGEQFSKEKTAEARKEDDTEFLTEYRKKDRRLSEAELREMRSEFGTGTEMVDVLTGRRFRI